MATNWTDEIGDHLLDLDRLHERHLELHGYACRRMADNNDPAAIKAALVELKAYAAIHFLEEERYFAISGFPGATTHRAAHAAYLAWIDPTAALCGEEQTSARTQMDVPTAWMHRHLIEEDGDYADYLRLCSGRTHPPPESETSGAV